MGNELDGSLVDVSRALKVLRVDLLKRRVLEPKVDVSPPVSLFRGGRHVCNCSLVHFSDSGWVRILAILLVGAIGVLFKSSEREPGVIVGAIVREFLFVLNSTFAQDGELDAGPITIYI